MTDAREAVLAVAQRLRERAENADRTAATYQASGYPAEAVRIRERAATYRAAAAETEEMAPPADTALLAWTVPAGPSAAYVAEPCGDPSCPLPHVRGPVTDHLGVDYIGAR